jgi:GntR family negative regulator for fad regulon and positive regulator of fabA
MELDSIEKKWYDLLPDWHEVLSMDIELKQPLRPALYAEYKLVTSILDGTYPPGSSLPSERLLAEKFHVTRPTLRETLHRLSSEGWLTIQHGRATTINDYWTEGGLRLLGTLARYGELLSKEFISCLLEVRVVMLPPVARLAIINAPDLFADYLSGYTNLEDDPEKFASFDWELQVLYARHSRNPVYPLILNDFSSVFTILAPHYFSLKKGRNSSRTYYRKLLAAIKKGDNDAEGIVREALQKSLTIWGELATKKEIT